MSGRAKLTLEQAEEIRKRVAKGEAQAAVARAFGVTQSTVGRIWLGINRTGKPRKNASDRHPLTEQQVKRLREAWSDGVSLVELRDRFGVPAHIVGRLVDGINRGAA